MDIVRPDCNVEAPPVVNFAFAADDAPLSLNHTNDGDDSTATTAAAALAVLLIAPTTTNIVMTTMASVPTVRWIMDDIDFVITESFFLLVVIQVWMECVSLWGCGGGGVDGGGTIIIIIIVVLGWI